MINWTCYNCGSYEVFESMFVRINRLACIIDDEEDLRGMDSPTAWCAKCETNVELIEASKTLYTELLLRWLFVRAMDFDRIGVLSFVFHI